MTLTRKTIDNFKFRSVKYLIILRFGKLVEKIDFILSFLSLSFELSL